MAYSSYSMKRVFFFQIQSYRFHFKLEKKKNEFSIVVPKLIHFKSISVYGSLTVNSIF